MQLLSPTDHHSPSRELEMSQNSSVYTSSPFIPRYTNCHHESAEMGAYNVAEYSHANYP